MKKPSVYIPACQTWGGGGEGSGGRVVEGGEKGIGKQGVDREERCGESRGEERC